MVIAIYLSSVYRYVLFIENMIYKGLDDEESKFLHLVSKQQAEQKAQRLQQEKEEILLFKIS